MEIEFNASQLPPARVNSPARTTAPRSTPSQPDALQGMAELQRKLNDMALTRPEKLAAARAIITDVKYPPDDLLNSIAHLLAIHLDH